MNADLPTFGAPHTTTHGEIVIALRPDHAPNTAWNFRSLSEGGFFDGIMFHRVVPLTANGDPFVIQAGDPSGTGEGGCPAGKRSRAQEAAPRADIFGSK